MNLIILLFILIILIIKLNSLNYLIDKIKEGEIKLADAKNDEIVFQSNLGEIKKETKK